jgi:hypothetical protein
MTLKGNHSNDHNPYLFSRILILILLIDFQGHEMALAAKLTEAEVAALRLYTGSISSLTSLRHHYDYG